MKIWESKKLTAKSWVIRLEQSGNESILVAIDAISGRIIANFIRWDSNGDIERMSCAENILITNGYDPYEHNNKYDDEGRWIID